MAKNVAGKPKGFGELEAQARNIRKLVLGMIHKSNSSHIGTSFSIVELLVGLYFSALRVDPARPQWAQRDYFLLSKGHGCAALYATLARRGFADEKMLDGFSVDGGTLWGHSTWKTMPGIEASTGSLGHGLPIGVGLALAAKLDKRPNRVFVLLGDGECDEGSVWEALLYAGHKKLDNLVAIIDYNKVQSFGNTKDVLDLEPFSDKWKAANWAAREIDGHDFGQITKALASVPFEPGKPSVVIAHTVKGKGVSFMENSLDWHYKTPDKEQLEKSIGEIDAKNICKDTS
ncbi:transketolase [Candidatus Parvarchaeota archaeon]|nr:transketolase [Candidatus Parvarchaeota archaeon]